MFYQILFRNRNCTGKMPQSGKTLVGVEILFGILCSRIHGIAHIFFGTVIFPFDYNKLWHNPEIYYKYSTAAVATR